MKTSSHGRSFILSHIGVWMMERTDRNAIANTARSIASVWCENQNLRKFWNFNSISVRYSLTNLENNVQSLIYEPRVTILVLVSTVLVLFCFAVTALRFIASICWSGAFDADTAIISNASSDYAYDVTSPLPVINAAEWMVLAFFWSGRSFVK